MTENTEPIEQADATTELVYIFHKTASCPSVSGKSTISYRLEVNADSQIFFQLVSNTGAGRYNDDRIEYADIRAILQQHLEDGISSGSLASLYPMKSSNSKSFLLATMLAEGLVQVMPTKEHRYEVLDDTAWLAQIQALVESPEDVPKKLPRKGNTKKG